MLAVIVLQSASVAFCTAIAIRAMSPVLSTCTCPGIAIGGDAYPGSTLSDHCLRYQNIPQIKMIVVLGELGGEVCLPVPLQTLCCSLMPLLQYIPNGTTSDCSRTTTHYAC